MLGHARLGLERHGHGPDRRFSDVRERLELGTLVCIEANVDRRGELGETTTGPTARWQAARSMDHQVGLLLPASREVGELVVHAEGDLLTINLAAK